MHGNARHECYWKKSSTLYDGYATLIKIDPHPIIWQRMGPGGSFWKKKNLVPDRRLNKPGSGTALSHVDWKKPEKNNFLKGLFFFTEG